MSVRRPDPDDLAWLGAGAASHDPNWLQRLDADLRLEIHDLTDDELDELDRLYSDPRWAELQTRWEATEIGDTCDA